VSWTRPRRAHKARVDVNILAAQSLRLFGPEPTHVPRRFPRHGHGRKPWRGAGEPWIFDLVPANWKPLVGLPASDCPTKPRSGADQVSLTASEDALYRIAIAEFDRALQLVISSTPSAPTSAGASKYCPDEFCRPQASGLQRIPDTPVLRSGDTRRLVHPDHRTTHAQAASTWHQHGLVVLSHRRGPESVRKVTKALTDVWLTADEARRSQTTAPRAIGQPRPPASAAPLRCGAADAGAQRAAIPSPPMALATATDPISVSEPLTLTANSSTIPFAPVWV
jgi:hypothetical protein